MTETPPGLELDLEWKGEKLFRGHTGRSEFILDGGGTAGPTPVEALALSLAGCMAIDIVLVLTRGRQDLRGLKTHLRGWRSLEDPKRIVRIELRYTLEGEITDDKIERAIALSREKYCSVWHTLRQDIDFAIAWDIVRPTAV